MAPNNQPTAPLEALPEGFNLVWECSACEEVLAHLEGCENDGKHPDEIIEAIEAALANDAPKVGHAADANGATPGDGWPDEVPADAPPTEPVRCGVHDEMCEPMEDRPGWCKHHVRRIDGYVQPTTDGEGNDDS